jgi:hypothetical protein
VASPLFIELFGWIAQVGVYSLTKSVLTPYAFQFASAPRFVGDERTYLFNFAARRTFGTRIAREIRK